MKSKIALAFNNCKKENRPALITYTVAGDNTKNNSLKILNKIYFLFTAPIIVRILNNSSFKVDCFSAVIVADSISTASDSRTRATSFNPLFSKVDPVLTRSQIPSAKPIFGAICFVGDLVIAVNCILWHSVKEREFDLNFVVVTVTSHGEGGHF